MCPHTLDALAPGDPGSPRLKSPVAMSSFSVIDPQSRHRTHTGLREGCLRRGVFLMSSRQR